jgi:hypothetical protein
MANFNAYGSDEVVPARPGDRLLPPPSTKSVYGVDVEDLGKGIVGGIARGGVGMAGWPGDVADLMAQGSEWAGLPPLPAELEQSRKSSRPFSSPEIQKGVEHFTGPFYQPHTVLGQVASTGAEYAPAAIIGGGTPMARIFSTAVPAVASETAGQLFQGDPYENWIRAIGGVSGGLFGAKALTPAAPASAMRQADVATLRGAKLPVSAAEVTGSEPIRWLEQTARQMPLSGGNRALETRGTALDKYIESHMFDPAQLRAKGVGAEEHLPASNVYDQGRQSLQDEYKRLFNRYDLRATPQLNTDLHAPDAIYQQKAKATDVAAGLKNIEGERDKILAQLRVNNWRMSGDQYQATRSDLGDKARQAFKDGDHALGTAFDSLQTSLDTHMKSQMHPWDAIALDLNNSRWGQMKQLSPAISGATTEHITPAKFAETLASGRGEQFAAARGPMDEVAAAARRVYKQLPMSGTAERQFYQDVLKSPGKLVTGGNVASTASGAVGGLFGGPLGAALGFAAPGVTARALVLSPPAQKYWGNQILPQSPRDILAQTLAQQAISSKGPLRQTEEME